MGKLRLIAGTVMLAFTFCSIGGCGKQPAKAQYDIVPLPAETVFRNQEPFVLDRSVIIYTYSTDNGLKNASFLSDYINTVCGFRPTIIASPDLQVTEDNSGKPIFLSVKPGAVAPDGYILEVSSDIIRITGSTDAGVFYGVQTLRKAMPESNSGKVEFPAATLTDYPHFPYRGFMLDVARSFFTVDQVKEYIDILALHNLNIFHWHLTDDQGWRIEIDSYPELVEKGAYRADSTGMYGGYYTKAEIKDVIAYAADRYIEVIPEIDLPGHMTAAIATYPHLGCTGGPYEITGLTGVRRDILCAGNPETYTFLENVLAEVAELFPSKYIHIGGDESPRTRWIACPKCQAKIAREGLRADEHQRAEDYLQGYMNIYFEKFLKEHGKTIIGWDEIVEGGLSPEATVMSWRGIEGGLVAAKAGHDVIMSPNSHLYFDYYQTRDVDNDPVAFGGYVPLERLYGFDPVPQDLSAQQKKHIIGLQANLWSPWLKEYKVAQYMTMPRIAGLSEVAWSYPAERDFTDFTSRLANLTKVYDNEGYTYRDTFYEITPSYDPDYGSRTLRVTLEANPAAKIYYTT
ncbi:MAG: beta-N-acetylhexosaminidase, partial [Alistipes sp.]|nr:beta-N-acetylhexosaminidase [Alistipes sp.]